MCSSRRAYLADPHSGGIGVFSLTGGECGADGATLEYGQSVHAGTGGGVGLPHDQRGLHLTVQCHGRVTVTVNNTRV